MKKIKFILLGLLSLFVFAGCSDGSEKGTGEQADPTNEKAKQVYENFIGTAWKCNANGAGQFFPEKLVFEKDSITFDNKRYSLNQNDLKIRKNHYYSEKLVFLIDDTEYGFYDSKNEYLNTNAPSTKITLFCENTDYIALYQRDSSSDNNGGEGNVSVADGTYSFTASGSSQTDGSFSLSDGTWTYSGSKQNMAAKSGTYTADGSKITVKWTMTGGTEVSETFTVSVDGSTATWTLSDGVNSTFFNMLFGVAAQTELIFKYTE